MSASRPSSISIVNIEKQRRKEFCGFYEKKCADFQDLNFFVQK